VLPLCERQSPCLVSMEACATAHHWAREIGAFGHEVRLMPPRYVKPYVKRNKNDAADAGQAESSDDWKWHIAAVGSARRMSAKGSQLKFTASQQDVCTGLGAVIDSVQ
jgi:hypothetical protein